jgi:DNA-binding transcriptional LysR family regulator
VPADLAQHVTINMSEDDNQQRWTLHGPGDSVEAVELRPRVAGFDFPLLRSLARRGVGITLLPENLCADLVHRGELEVVLPAWRLPEGICHAVFASRRGLLPAVRVFIDFLAERLPPLLESARIECRGKHG